MRIPTLCLLSACGLLPFLAISPASAQPGPGWALSFDGVASYVQIGGAPLPPPWTAEFWVNRQDAPHYSASLLGDGSTALKLEQFNFTRQVGFTQFGVADYTFNYAAPSNTWVHLAFVCDTTTRLYVNGVLQDSNPATIPLPLGRLGYDSRGNLDYMRGILDEVRIWNVARAQADILANMLNTALSGATPGLMAYWHFNEGAGTTTADATGHGNTGTLVNGPAWVQLPNPGPPTLATQPQDQSATPGGRARFSVSASNSWVAGYQWFFNQTNVIAGGSSATLTISNVQATSEGTYSVVVTNPYGAVTSSVAVLTVTTFGPVETILLYSDQMGSVPNPYGAALNNLGLAYQLFSTNQALAFSVAVGSANPGNSLVVVDAPYYSQDFTTVARFADAGGRALLQYYGLADGSSLADAFNVTVRQAFSSPWPVYDWGGPGFFAGVSSPVSMTDNFNIDGQNLEPTPGGVAAAGFVSQPMAAEAAVVIGNTGRTIVNGFALEEATLGAQAVTFAQNEIQWLLPVVTAPEIFGQPQNQTAISGSPLTLSVGARGSLPLSFQWFFNQTNPVAWATNASLTFAGVTVSQEGTYFVVVTNPYGAVTSSSATLTVVSLAGALNTPDWTYTLGGNAAWTPESTITHDGVSAAQSGTITEGQESWLETTVTGPGVVAFWWKASSEGDCDLLQFFVNDVVQAQISGEADWQQVAFAVPAGSQTLRWRYVKDIGTDAGLDHGWVDQVTYAPNSGPPLILLPPASQTVVTGVTVNLQVSAAGSPPLSYQWFFDETNALAGATSATLALPNVQLTNAGTYCVTVSNLLGAVTSSTAVVSVTTNSLVNTVLLLVDSPYASPYQDALLNQGRAFQLFSSTEELAFNRGLASANPGSTLVVVDATWLSHNFDAVTRFLQAGGRAILEYVYLNTGSAAAAFNATAVATVYTPLPVYDWGGSSLFAGLSSPLNVVNAGFNINGQNLQPAAGGQAVAGFVSTATANQAAVVVGNSGRSIVNGCFLEDISPSASGDLFAQNEIEFLIGPPPPIPPVITVQPQSQTVVVGATATLQASASGSAPLWYQWRKDTLNVVGGTNPVLRIAQAQPEDAGPYSMVVTNAYGAVTSSVAVLTVTNLGPVETILLYSDQVGGVPNPYGAALNNLGLAYQLFSTNQMLAFSVAVGSANPGSSLVVVDAPDYSQDFTTLVRFADAGGRALLQYYGLADGSSLADAFNVTVSQVFSSPWPVYDWSGPGFFAGVSSPVSMTDNFIIDGQNLEPTPGGVAAAGFVSQPMAAEAAVVIGNTGRTIVNGFTLEETAVSAQAVTFAQNEIQWLLPVVTAPEIFVQPQNQAASLGSPATLSVGARGSLPLSFQWFFNQTNAGAWATNADLTFTALTPNQAGTYFVVVTNPYGAVTSSSATLTVMSLAGALNTPGWTYTLGGNAVWTPESAVTHDGVSAAQSGHITDSQESWMETTVSDGPGTLSFWWKVSSESSYDFLEFYLNGVLQSGRISGEVDWQQQTFRLLSGSQRLRWRYAKDYSVSVGQDKGWVDQISWIPDCTNCPPVITQQPQSLGVAAGSNAIFSVTATGTAPLLYQWYFNATNLPGATNPTVTVTGVGTNQLGDYVVVVANAFGAVTSQVATLELLAAPAFIQQPQSQTVALGSDLTLSVSVSGSLPMSYRWRRGTTSLTNLILGQRTCTFTLTNVQLSTSAVYTVVVTNVAGRASGGPQPSLSSNAYVTVVVPPTSQTVAAGSNVTFQARASGGTGITLHFQWCFSGTNLPGATNTNLALPNVQPSQAGTYTFVVTNGGGQATGFDAVLAVLTPNRPTISHYARLTDGRFQLQFDGTAGANYTVLVSTNLTSWEVLGTATETGSGSFEFTEAQAAPSDCRFYRLRSP